MEGETKHVSAKSLECPMCMNIFKQPKILPCSHTYCKACLERLLEYHEDDRSIKCPVCRVVNQLPNRDVNQLQSNLALQSLLEDVHKECHSCTDCKAKGKNKQAKVNCRDCRKNLCLNCQEIHDNSFHDHEVLPINEVLREEAPSQQRRKCRKHPDDEDQCFCHDCCKYVCMKCGMTEHVYKGHHIIDASDQECIQRKAVEELKSKADTKKAGLQKYINIIDKQEEETRKVRQQCIDDINQAYDESVRQLTERKKILVQEVMGKIKKLETELHSLKETAKQQTNHVTTMIDLIANTNQALLETEALAAHVTLRQDLGAVLKQPNPDSGHPLKLGTKGKQVAFNKNMRIKEFSLGSIFEKNAGSAIPDGMNAMTSTPDGMMAVGCFHGGIKIFSSQGLHQQTVLSEVRVRGIGFLSDGRLVVRSTSGALSIFTPEYEKLDVKFDSVSDKLNGSGDLAVTAADEICVGNMENKKIEVFSPTGGKAIREIACREYGPHQIMGYGNALLITHAGVARLVDTFGREWYSTGDSNYSCYGTVTQRKTVLIAWVNHNKGLVSVEEYTNELVYYQAVVPEYEIEKPKRNWYSLQEFTSGDIAFCTPDRLYIFKREIICTCI